jgi:hypothetical protein
MIWYVWIACAIGFELFAGIEHKRDVPMLTQAVVRYVPWQIMLPFLVWLFCHFATRYFNHTYIAWLRAGGAGN